GYVFQCLFQTEPELVADFAFEDVKDQLEANMDVGVGDPTGRDGSNVSRQFGRADVLRRHALFIVNAVPIPPRAAAADGENAVVIFDCAQLDFVFVVLHKPAVSQYSTNASSG